MKKILMIVAVLIVATGAFFLSKKEKPESNKQTVSLFSNFEANLHFKMVSNGSFMGNGGQGLTIMTDLEGYPEIAFDRKAGILKVMWTPVMILKVNNILKEEYKKDFDSVKNETFYVHFNSQMVMDKILYKKRDDIDPSVQELVLNFNKMLAHQAAWYFSLAPLEKISVGNGVDIWGETVLSLKNDGKLITVDTKSIEGKSSQTGTGHFEIKREADGKLNASGTQKSSMGGGQQSLATTENKYTLTTVAYKETGDLAISINMNELTETPPWLVVDAEAMKLASLKEKLKGWDKAKLQKSVFNFKMAAGAPYKDKAEISALLTDMLQFNPTLAASYYEWIKKLGPKHVLYDEMIRSFSVVGCEDCQKFLIQVTKDYKKDDEATQKSLFATGFLKSPLESTEQELRDIAGDIEYVNHDLADYMLANMASSLEEKEPARAQKIDSDFVSKLKQARTNTEINHSLIALGNSGVCNDYKAIENFTNHKDVQIKRDAVMALRFCENENVGKLYRKLYKEQTELRPAIIQASEMRAQKPLLEAEQFEFFRKEIESGTGDEQEKRSIIGFLRAFSFSSDPYREQLIEIQKNCSQYKICQLFN